MEQFAPLIGIGLGALIAIVIWSSQDALYRREKKSVDDKLNQIMGMSTGTTLPPAPPGGYTGYGFTGYGPTDTRYDPYGLNKPKDNNQSLKDGLKKLL